MKSFVMSSNCPKPINISTLPTTSQFEFFSHFVEWNLRKKNNVNHLFYNITFVNLFILILPILIILKFEEKQ